MGHTQPSDSEHVVSQRVVQEPRPAPAVRRPRGRYSLSIDTSSLREASADDGEAEEKVNKAPERTIDWDALEAGRRTQVMTVGGTDVEKQIAIDVESEVERAPRSLP